MQALKNNCKPFKKSFLSKFLHYLKLQLDDIWKKLCTITYAYKILKNPKAKILEKDRNLLKIKINLISKHSKYTSCNNFAYVYC